MISQRVCVVFCPTGLLFHLSVGRIIHCSRIEVHNLFVCLHFKIATALFDWLQFQYLGICEDSSHLPALLPHVVLCPSLSRICICRLRRWSATMLASIARRCLMKHWILSWRIPCHMTSCPVVVLAARIAKLVMHSSNGIVNTLPWQQGPLRSIWLMLITSQSMMEG